MPIYKPNASVYLSFEDLLKATSLETAVECANYPQQGLKIIQQQLNTESVDLDYITQESPAQIEQSWRQLGQVLISFARQGFPDQAAQQILRQYSTMPDYGQPEHQDQDPHLAEDEVTMAIFCTQQDNGGQKMICIAEEYGDFEWTELEGQIVITNWENKDISRPPKAELCYHDYTAIWQYLRWALFQSTFSLFRHDRGKLGQCKDPDCHYLLFRRQKQFCSKKCKWRNNKRRQMAYSTYQPD